MAVTEGYSLLGCDTMQCEELTAILAAFIYWCLAWLTLTLKVEVIFSFEMPGFLKSTWSDTPEDCTLQCEDA
jgi:hypothetical protein